MACDSCERWTRCASPFLKLTKLGRTRQLLSILRGAGTSPRSAAAGPMKSRSAPCTLSCRCAPSELRVPCQSKSSSNIQLVFIPVRYVLSLRCMLPCVIYKEQNSYVTPIDLNRMNTVVHVYAGDALCACTSSCQYLHVRNWHSMQVMVACEPSDSILAALLQANDDLLAAVHSWENTASRLVMLQSRPAASASTHSQGSASSRIASTAPEVSDSSSSSASDLVPTHAPSGGLFWSHSEAAPAPQPPRSSSQQQQASDQSQQRQQNRSEFGQQLYPTLFEGDSQQSQQRGHGTGGAAARQQQGNSQMHSSGSYLDDLAGLQPQYPHQPADLSHQTPDSDASWQAFGAHPSKPSALAVAPADADQQSAGSAAADQPKEFHGTVLSYRLATPKHALEAEQASPFDESDREQQHLQDSSQQPEPAPEAVASSSDLSRLREQSFDPFAGMQRTLFSIATPECRLDVL